MNIKKKNKIHPRVLKKLLATSMLIASTFTSTALAADYPKISIVINQSPWLESFISVVDKYEAETGNKIELDVTPFGGLLEKIRNSIRGEKSVYDIVNINSGWLAEIYSGGFLAPIAGIETNYVLPQGVLNYGNTTNWNNADSIFDKSGELMGIPLNGNVQVLYYRKDLYEKMSLNVPKTWEELEANAKKLHDAPNMYGFVPRAARNSIVYNFTPYLYSHGGSVLANPESGDFAVTINSDKALSSLETYLKLASTVAPKNPGAIAQGELIQLLSTGKAAHAIAVIGAWGGLENPDKSVVVGKLGTALLPSGAGGSASAAGHWVGGIPNNISDERKEAAMNFLDWFLQKQVQVSYVEAGGVPVRGDLADTSIAGSNKYRFIDAYSANAKNAVMALPLKEGAELSDALGLRLNQAVIGELSAKEALNLAAKDIHNILKKAGYKTSLLPNLK